MSECILCKGSKLVDSNRGVKVVEIDNFLREMAMRIWRTTDEIWTIRINEKEIDYYLIKAQEEIGYGTKFESTEFYAIIGELLNAGVKIAMWYDTYCEDLPICKSNIEVLDACYNGIVDDSGMCEVYFMMN